MATQLLETYIREDADEFLQSMFVCNRIITITVYVISTTHHEPSLTILMSVF